MEKLVAQEEDLWVDKDWGEIVSVEAVSIDDEWPLNKGTCVPNYNPLKALCNFRVSYENGNVANLTAKGWMILNGFGFHGTIEKGENEYWDKETNTWNSTELVEEPIFFNIRLMATVASYLSEGRFIAFGNVPLLEEKESLRILNEFDIANYPIAYSDEHDAEVAKKWRKKWLDDGVCISVPERWNGDVVSRMLYEEEKRMQNGKELQF